MTVPGEDICGTRLDGVPLTDADVLDQVCAAGSLTVVRGPGQRLRRSGWAEDLSALARARGLRLAFRAAGRTVVVLDASRHQLFRPEDASDGDHSTARAAHPSRTRGPRLVPAPGPPEG